MTRVVLGTDVASLSYKGRLPASPAARLVGREICVTFVTVGELARWAEKRHWGTRTRARPINDTWIAACCLVADLPLARYMMQGLDPTADLVFMVGYHGSISGESSVLSHTYNPSVISHVELNGVRVGESSINALVALGCQVPVGLITGDQHTAAEADPFLPDAERVVVKESFTRFGASNLHPEVARTMIADGARRAVERAAAARPPAIALPATLEVQLQTADMAEVASWVRGAERTGTRAVSIRGDDPLAMFRSFVAVTYITRVAEGR